MTESIKMTDVRDWGPLAGEPEVEFVPQGERNLSDRLETLVDKEFESWRDFSYETFLDENISEVGIGVGVGLLSFFTLGQMNAIFSLLSGGAVAGGSNGIISAAITIGQLPMGLVGVALKISFFAITSLFIPYVEEFLFRGLLHEALETDLGDKFVQGMKILANAFIFTLCHIPVLLPQISALFLIQIFFLGIALAAVRVYAESRIASTAAHMTYNGLIFGSILILA